jgi:hypothetical protein
MLFWIVLVIVKNASLSVTLPDGYHDVSAEAVKLANGNPGVKDAIAFMKGAAGAADAASINFIRTEHHPEYHYGDAKECTAFASDMRVQQHANSVSSAIVDGPTSKTCEVSLTYDNGKMLAVSTILQGPKDTWIMTCVMTPSNAAAVKQCRTTRATVKFR